MGEGVKIGVKIMGDMYHQRVKMATLSETNS